MEEVKVDTEEFKRFVRLLGKVDPDLKKALRKRLTAEAKPIVQAVKQAALSLPANRSAGDTRKRKGQTLGLRASLAAAAKSDYSATRKGAVMHIRISSTRFNAVSGRENRSLPYYVEGRRKRAWRHPVYGNRDNWVEQKKTPFLWRTVAEHKGQFERSVMAAVDDALQELDNKVN